MADYMVHIPKGPPVPLGLQHAECRIGRRPDLELVLDDSAVSRLHARLLWTPEGLVLEDLGSRHGCRVNGLRVGGSVPVKPGDLIEVGPVPLRLEPAEAVEATLSLSMRPEALLGWRGAVGILHEISLLMVRDLSADTLLEALLEKLCSHCGTAHGTVLLKEEGGLRTLASRGHGAGSGFPRHTLEAALARYEAQVFPSSSPSTGTASLTLMMVPLAYGHEVLGLVCLEGESCRAGGEEELRFVAALCNLAAAKIIHQRDARELQLRREQERELELARAAAQARSEFLARISHEIRTPMNAILGFADLAAGQDLSHPVGDCIGKIQSAGRLLLALLNDVLDLSKLEASAVEIEQVPLSLDGLLRGVEDLFTGQARAKGLEFRVGCAPGLPEAVVGDPLRLSQVLINLVGNALKFTPQGGVALEVTGAPRSEGPVWDLIFTVSDTGIGMSDEVLKRLFSPFRQADPSVARVYGGSGLGLSICRQLVELMDGSIEVESRPGGGSRFMVRLALPQGPPPPEEEPGPSEALLKGFRVLLVEDFPPNREVIAAMLEALGAQVSSAGSGEEALGRARPGCFDAILMDLELPGADGAETARRLRSDPGLERLPIIALTAHTDARARDAALQAGMDAMLTKPIDFRQLARVLTPFAPPDPVGSGALSGWLRRLESVMDVASALKRLDGNEALLLKVVQGFRKELPSLGRIPALLAEGDLHEALRIAHSFKGGALMLSLDAVAQAAGNLERCLRHGGLQGWESDYRSLVEALGAFDASSLEINK
nr:ATP-binding protein [uncultured Holophaga sp.]